VLPWFQPLFVAVNAAFGILVGALSARVPAFTALGIPSFLWLVAGLFASEMSAGLIFKAHPAALLSMPWRAAALAVSFIACYATLALLS
jgi:hypothetical protein